ncbi:adenylate isopentenyltransferase 4 [Fusarium albosuccineum]|uniref:Adenylate isopentenyltransferase 4 n=1 Tax=Fusarium albosuccineum TaxID=1237068 RepID=A0A8H4LQM5_9HYPO|nr:adenylate isopentenyltransferase 4 [Fusarium albosuccineum]
MASYSPIIVIIGPTGIGKTRLSVEVATAVDGEVISVDSIQVYRDCPIMAAQVTADEMKGIPHHLVNYLSVAEEPVDFIARAVQSVKSIYDRGRIPVICGGSTSLMEPLLFHPFIKQQKLLVLALISDISTIRSLCDDRITQMMKDGLLDEVKHLHNLEKRCGLHSNPHRRGAWKSIGYPELRTWCDAGNMEEAEKLLKDGTELMKQNTLQYASTQLDLLWTRLIPAMSGMQTSCVIFNVISRQTFSENVEIPALKLCKGWLLSLRREGALSVPQGDYPCGDMVVHPITTTAAFARNRDTM